MNSADLIAKHSQEFELLYKLYTEYNSHTNLSSIRDREGVYSKHFVDSLSIVNLIDSNTQKIIDIGTGGGFPALPLAIVFPQIKITAVDSVGKKINFVKAAALALNLQNLEVIHCRAEDLAHDESYRESYDMALSRAVAELRILLELCIPFVKVNGKFIAYKKSQIELEIAVAAKIAKELNTKLIEQIEDDEKQLLVFAKQARTASKYPREFKQIKNKS